MFPLVLSPAPRSDALPLARKIPPGRAAHNGQNRTSSHAVAADRADGPRILLVDDDPVLLDLSESVLTVEGYRVLTCGSAEEALRSYRREPEIDLLVTDIQMPPGISGLELAGILTREAHALPVVVMSGAIIKDEQQRLMLEQGWSFIDKPLSVPRLLSVISVMLHRRPVRASGGPAPLRKAG